MSDSKSFHHNLLDSFEQDFSGEVQKLNVYQDSGANIMFRGRPALFIAHGIKAPAISIRIKRNRGYSLYDTWLKSSQHLDIDLLITGHVGWNNIRIYEAVPWSRVEYELKKFAKNNPEAYNYEQDIVTYADGNQSLVLDRYLGSALYRLIPHSQEEESI